MNKEQIIDKVYENYFLKTENITLETLHVPYRNTHLYGTVSGPISNTKFRPYTQDEFINKCKTDTEFSETWGLQIEERELSRKERSDYYYKHGNSEGIVEGSLDLPIWVNDETAHVWYDKRNVPTQQITLTYKDTIIESYE